MDNHVIIPQRSGCWQRCLEHIHAYRGTFETGKMVLARGGRWSTEEAAAGGPFETSEPSEGKGQQ